MKAQFKASFLRSTTDQGIDGLEATIPANLLVTNCVILDPHAYYVQELQGAGHTLILVSAQ